MEENKIRIEKKKKKKKKKKKVSKWCDRIELIGKAKRAGKERQLTSIASLLFSSLLFLGCCCLPFFLSRESLVRKRS